MFNEPVNQLFCNKAVWVGFEMVPSIFNNLFFMEPQPAGVSVSQLFSLCPMVPSSVHAKHILSCPLLAAHRFEARLSVGKGVWSCRGETRYLFGFHWLEN